MSNEQKPSDADMALAREWAPSDPEWSLTVIAKRIARVRREARAEAFEEARKIALPAHADAIEGHGNAGNQNTLRRMLADEFSALAAKERAS